METEPPFLGSAAGDVPAAPSSAMDAATKVEKTILVTLVETGWDRAMNFSPATFLPALLPVLAAFGGA
jgi:hypothetical protein